jgi:hypothetical protein
MEAGSLPTCDLGYIPGINHGFLQEEGRHLNEFVGDGVLEVSVGLGSSAKVIWNGTPLNRLSGFYFFHEKDFLQAVFQAHPQAVEEYTKLFEGVEDFFVTATDDSMEIGSYFKKKKD